MGLALRKAAPRARNLGTLARIMDKAEPKLVAAFLRAVASTQSEATLAEIQRALDRGDIEGAVRAVPWDEVGGRVLESDFMRQFRDVYDEAGAVSARIIEGVKPFDFTVTNDRGLRYIEQHGAALVQQIGEDTRTAIRNTLVRMQREGLSSNATARILMEQIGLTDRLTGAVLNYRAGLLRGGEQVGRVNEMTKTYARRLRFYRANGLARNESAMASSAGRGESWLQAAERGLFDPELAEEEWNTADDERVCPRCAPMDGQRVPFGSGFTTGDGDIVFSPPAHLGGCRCDESLLVDVRKRFHVIARKTWDESKHPRGETTPESTPGSFAPSAGGGIVGEGSAEASTTVAAFKEKHRESTTEHALIHKDGKAVILKHGGAHSITFSDDEVAAMRGGSFTHNHPPGSANLSPADFELAARADLTSMEAFGVDHAGVHWEHRIERPAGGWPAEADLKRGFATSKRVYMPLIVKQAKAGKFGADRKQAEAIAAEVLVGKMSDAVAEDFGIPNVRA